MTPLKKACSYDQQQRPHTTAFTRFWIKLDGVVKNPHLLCYSFCLAIDSTFYRFIKLSKAIPWDKFAKAYNRNISFT